MVIARESAQHTTDPLAGPVLDEREALLLYDGVCGLCDNVVQFLLARDTEGRFRFAPLQGPTAERVLARHGIDASDLDTFHLVLNVGLPTERVISRGRGAAATLRHLGGSWALLGGALALLPTFLVDLGYRFVARVRYRVFGKADQCLLPSPQQRARFFE